MGKRNDDENRHADPGLRGGPGTLHGVNFQIRVAVLRAVQLIRRQFGAPHLPLLITVERLIPHARGGGESWDVVTEAPRERIEAKVSPSAADVRKWLFRAKAVPGTGATLVYSKETGAVKALLKLKQRAETSASDIEFDLYVSGHASEAEQELLSILGEDALRILQAIRLEHLPEAALDDLIYSTAEPFAGADGARALVQLLGTELLAAGSSRTTFTINELVSRAKAQGITLVAPPFPNASDLAPAARSVLGCTQALPAALPLDVLASVFRQGPQELEEALRPLLDADRLELREGLVGPKAACERINDPNHREVEGRLLDLLLRHIETNSRSMQVDAQVDNAIELASRRKKSHPEVVAHVFPVLDKLLKRRGDRGLVYRVADRSIRAANKAERSDAIVKAHAISLICGRSWAWQRNGDLSKARADGEASLQLGIAIGWARNTAFCHKCLGRLSRLEGEQSPAVERMALLEASIESLELSIEEFGKLGEEGEVGDAYSLLGRTYLVAGRIVDAERAIEAATIRLTDIRDKDYIDLQVLQGDIKSAGGQFDEAQAFYHAAIGEPGSDAGKNEIRARALNQRAINSLAMGDVDGARQDFVAAAAIHEAFDDIDGVAMPQLEILKIDGLYPNDEVVADLLAKESRAVQVAAIQAAAEAQFVAAPRPAASQTASLQSLSVWQAHISRARKEVAGRRRSW